MTTSTATLNSCWQPSADDHLIYRWVKFEGYTQSQVASMLRIHQSTVSRVIQRYERWQAHHKDREGGRLDPQERLRAQRWLTYERNELILASCLRIADEMERSTELSKTTIRRPIDQPNCQTEVRTEGRVIDRHGVASRFLRLAFRVNMEQLKLTALIARDSQTPLEPLSDEELAAELHQAALDAAELAAARNVVPSLREGLGDECSIDSSQPVGWAPPTADRDVGCVDSPSGDATHHPAEPPTPCPQPPAPAVVHNLHNESVLEITTTPNAPCTCRLQTSPEKISRHTCIIDCDQPSWPYETQTPSTSQRPETRLAVAATEAS